MGRKRSNVMMFFYYLWFVHKLQIFIHVYRIFLGEIRDDIQTVSTLLHFL